MTDDLEHDPHERIRRLKAEAIAEARAELGPEPPDDGHAATILRRAKRGTQPYLTRERTQQNEE